MLTATDGVGLARSTMLMNFCAGLDTRQIPYVILSGYQDYPERIDSDVDLMVSEADFLRLPALFSEPDFLPGAQLLQVVQNGISARNYVLAIALAERIAYLHPDAAFDFRSKGRLVLCSQRVLETRRKASAGFWIPAAAVEFEYYLVKRVDKGLVEPRHLDHLAALVAEDADGCRTVLARIFSPRLSDAVHAAIIGRNTAWFASHTGRLGRVLAESESAEGPAARFASMARECLRRLRRIAQPTGLVIAVLGPDGSGKTTVIEHLERELAPAFRSVRRFHLRPRFGAAFAGRTVSNPHGQPPRGHLLSAAKVGLFLLDYWLGWLLWVQPARTRWALVIFDRYYHDMLVDHARYRLARDNSVPRWLAGLAPRPDIWIVLNAPAELLVARKREITPEAAEALSRGYESLAQRMGATLIDTGRSLEETLAEIVKTPLDYLAARTQRRFGSGS